MGKKPEPKALRFQELACLVDVSFWQWIIQRKLNVWKLQCPPLRLRAKLESAPTTTARPILRLDAGSPMEGDVEETTDLFTAEGVFYHVNTLEDFTCFPFTECVAETITATLDFCKARADCAGASLESVSTVAEPEPIDWRHQCASVLTRFFLVAYMDLKRYAMVYVVSCPTLGSRTHGQVGLTRPPSPRAMVTDKKRKSALPPATNPLSVPRGKPRASSLPPVGLSPTAPPVITSKTNRFLCLSPPHLADADFTSGELLHIGRHLIDACCCHNSYDDRRSTAGVCLVVRHAFTGGLSFVSLSVLTPDILDFIRKDGGREIYIAFVDFGRSMAGVGWPSRNLLVALCCVLNLSSVRLQLLAFRDINVFQSGSMTMTPTVQSAVFHIRTPSSQQCSQVLLAGWLTHKRTQSVMSDELSTRLPFPRYSIFTLNLQSFLDNRVVQQDATELNVKLIKWRILPSFQPELLQQLRFLIIGMGTLGCQVARDLVGWGVTKLTLLDCGVVAPSNPARQSLYQAGDVETGGGVKNKKCLIAKKRLLEIRGDLEIQTVDLEVPMPSQQRFLLPVSQFLNGEEDDETPYVIWMHDKLRKLIETHDVVLLLTDSRESRWLPSLIVQNISYNLAQKKPDTSVADRLMSPFYPPLCVTVALGFDTFVVIRHGTFCDGIVPPTVQVPDPESNEKFFKPEDTLRARLSCYFCNDLTAPSSIGSRHRTLDQQCTVTRAGVAPFAGSIAVELVTSLSQAALGFGAMPRSRRQDLLAKFRANRNEWDQSTIAGLTAAVQHPGHVSCLGECPHVFRGSVSGFTLVSDWHPSFDTCVCCGTGVQAAYELAGAAFVEEVVRDSSILESVSGLNRLKANSAPHLNRTADDIWVIESGDEMEPRSDLKRRCPSSPDTNI